MYVFAAVDRCERLAGLLLKLRGFQQYLNTYPDAQQRVVLVQYAYPTISYWDDTHGMQKEITELAENINAFFAVDDEGSTDRKSQKSE